MAAEIIYPIESQSVISLRKQIAAKDIQEEFVPKRIELFDKIRTAFGLPKIWVHSSPQSDAGKKTNAQYEKELSLLNEETQKHTANVIRQIEQNYKNERNVQASIAMNLSRISPISCYTYLLSELSGTGISELENFDENAQRYQDKVKKSIYDNYSIISYGGAGAGTATSLKYIDGFNEHKASIPEMRYRYLTLADALQAC